MLISFRLLFRNIFSNFSSGHEKYDGLINVSCLVRIGSAKSSSKQEFNAAPLILHTFVYKVNALSSLSTLILICLYTSPESIPASILYIVDQISESPLAKAHKTGDIPLSKGNLDACTLKTPLSNFSMNFWVNTMSKLNASPIVFFAMLISRSFNLSIFRVLILYFFAKWFTVYFR